MYALDLSLQDKINKSDMLCLLGKYLNRPEKKVS